MTISLPHRVQGKDVKVVLDQKNKHIRYKSCTQFYVNSHVAGLKSWTLENHTHKHPPILEVWVNRNQLVLLCH